MFYLLEDDVECWLLNARHLRNVPGRKTDVADAAWIAQLVEHGLVHPSFVPPKPIRELRNLTRYRRAQIQERGREVQRLDKLLQDAGIKLSSVATDVMGVSGRAMLAPLIGGQADPAAMADLAKGRMRTKLPLLEKALRGRFTAHHALLVGQILAKVDFLGESIGRLSDEIDRMVRPFARQRDPLDTIPCPPSTGGHEDAAATPRPSAPSATASSSPPTTCSTVTPPYQDLRADWFLRRHSPEHRARQLVHQLKALGYEVEVQQGPTAA